MSKPNKSLLTEDELLNSEYRKYEGKDMTIFYNRSKCQHAAECVKGNPAVFEVGRKPWIIADNGESMHNEEVINLCPTGALKYHLKESN